MLKKLAIVGLAAATLAVLPGTAQAADIITNGNFDAGSPAITGYTTLGSGSTAITGWTVTQGTVDYIHGYWPDQGGDGYSVDLSGNAPGALTQLLNTVAGQTYQVAFFLGDNVDGQPTNKIVNVLANVGSVDGALIGSQLFTYTPVADPSVQSQHVQGYTPFSFFFTASSNQTALTFASQSGTAYGAVLDTVSASAVPELGSWALMLAGFGIVGAMSRRRRGAGAAAFA